MMNKKPDDAGQEWADLDRLIEEITVDAHKILMEICEADPRCLDAHAHLGNFIFARRPEDAIRHYEVGVSIGELSLGPDFDGLLP